MGSAHVFKTCAECKKRKSVEEFSPTKRGRDSYCKACRRERDHGRRADKLGKYAKRRAVDPFYLRRYKLLRTYGITHEQYMEMHVAQRGLCAICGLPEKRILYEEVCLLSVDHNHASGKVRGLLCYPCNTGLGRIEDRAFLEKALAYLERHNSRPGAVV